MPRQSDSFNLSEIVRDTSPEATAIKVGELTRLVNSYDSKLDTLAENISKIDQTLALMTQRQEQVKASVEADHLTVIQLRDDLIQRQGSASGRRGLAIGFKEVVVFVTGLVIVGLQVIQFIRHP